MSEQQDLPFRDNIVETLWYYEFKPIDCAQRDAFIQDVISLCLTRTDDSYDLHTITQFKRFCAKTYRLEKEVFEDLMKKTEENIAKMDKAIEEEMMKETKDNPNLGKYRILRSAYSIYREYLSVVYKAHELRSLLMPEPQENS